MIQETVTYSCRTCGSINIVKNGTNKCGNAQYHCKDCGAYRVLKAQGGYTAEQRRQVIDAYRERMSLRGGERVFGVCRQTVMGWLKQRVATLPSLAVSLLPAQPDDVLEVDEAWSFVDKKAQKRCLWTVLCRRTRQIVAFVIHKSFTGGQQLKLMKIMPISLFMMVGSGPEQNLSVRTIWGFEV